MTTMARKPPRRLRIVSNETPWTKLAAALNGDPVHDDELVDQFMRKAGSSRASVVSQLRQYGISIPEHWSRGEIKTGDGRARRPGR